MGGAPALSSCTIIPNEGFCCSHDCSILRRLEGYGYTHTARTEKTVVRASHTEKISAVASAQTVVCNPSGFGGVCVCVCVRVMINCYSSQPSSESPFH